jgi:hypothetical protein
VRKVAEGEVLVPRPWSTNGQKGLIVLVGGIPARDLLCGAGADKRGVLTSRRRHPVQGTGIIGRRQGSTLCRLTKSFLAPYLRVAEKAVLLQANPTWKLG